ncbi:Uncharacterised protein [uncultured archaeon]|nr:Uncharacterised protein [uncultured archaeon]
MITYVFPNLSTMKQRGNIDSRKSKAEYINKLFNNDDFKIVEIPADFIKNQTEETKTGLLPCSFLDNNTVQKLYDKSFIKSDYILHTEPELYRPKCSKRTMPNLNWYDETWLNNFINHVFSIIDYFEQLPYAIEIHPGLAQNGKNNYKAYTNAIKFIFNSFVEKYNRRPLILIENRTNSFIKSGDDISNFWNIFQNLAPELVNNVGIILDIQQLFTSCKLDLKNQIDKIPSDSIKGFHIHRLHRTPKKDDGIDWEYVSHKIKQVENEKIIVLLLEVHREEDLIRSYKFCKEFLKL